MSNEESGDSAAEQERVSKQKQKQKQQEIKMGEMPLQPSVVSPKVGFQVTNLCRFLKSVTPCVSARSLLEVNAKEYRTDESNLHSYFRLSDLWESFGEPSAYGAAVPYLLLGKDHVEQYYNPTLSGMELYMDTSRPTSISLCEEKRDEPHKSQSKYGNDCPEADRTTESASHSSTHQMENLSPVDVSSENSSGSKADNHTAHRSSSAFFQYLEEERPYDRKPLAAKVLELSSSNPELNSCKSCDLLPTSWICVAWYPITRNPRGPTMKDLEACFLTFHALSTQSKCKFPPKIHAANTREHRGVVDPSSSSRITLPVFGLATYKLKGSLLNPSTPQEHELQILLWKSADDWLQHLQVALPDYRFFRTRYFDGR